jgi:tetratricopeptide (TPR) repeat protein
MSWFNEFSRKLGTLTGSKPASRDLDDDQIEAPEIETQIGAFGKLLISILVFPLQVLFLPMRTLGLFHQSGVDNGEYQDFQNLSLGGKVWHGLKRGGKGLLMLPYLIVTSPIRFFRGVAQSSTKEVLFIIPALMMVAFLGYVGAQVIGRGETIQNRYSKDAQQALDDGDFVKAKTYFKRIMQDDELSQPQKLQWMVVLAETGERAKAEEVLAELAPEDAVGFAPAHKVKALQIASRLKRSDNPLKLASLEKHLSRSRDESPLIQEAWAIYYKLVDKPDKAIESLKKAARFEPTYYSAIARYQGKLNRAHDQRETLKTAEQEFRRIVDKEPLNNRVRILLANTVAQQNKIDEAEKILSDGMARKPDDLIRVATAEFFLMRHDLEKAGSDNTGKRISYLFRALSSQPNHPPTYQRLMQMAVDQNSDESSYVRIRDELRNLIAEGDTPSPMAHFALSNILWQKEDDREKAQYHLELAHQIEPKFVIVLNNLAWMLAHQEKPDLERALKLVNTALDASPEDGRYRDTRGSIYMKMEQYQDAIADFEASLDDVEDQVPVRKKLVAAYNSLGLTEEAAAHQRAVEASN